MEPNTHVINPSRPYYVYLASRYSRKQELIEYRKELQSIIGVDLRVVSTWLDNPQVTGIDGKDAAFIPDAAVVYAKQDYHDILSADCLIQFTDPPSSTFRRGAAHCEFGIALALDKRCMIVGPRQQIFHTMPQVEQYESFSRLLCQFNMEGEY